MQIKSKFSQQLCDIELEKIKSKVLNGNTTFLHPTRHPNPKTQPLLHPHPYDKNRAILTSSPTGNVSVNSHIGWYLEVATNQLSANSHEIANSM